MKKILDEAEVQRNLNFKRIKKQMSKQFNYSLNDFEIYDSQWKHKDWKTWCKGCGQFNKTKELVERYIAESLTESVIWILYIQHNINYKNNE